MEYLLRTPDTTDLNVVPLSGGKVVIGDVKSGNVSEEANSLDTSHPTLVLLHYVICFFLSRPILSKDFNDLLYPPPYVFDYEEWPRGLVAKPKSIDSEKFDTY